MCSVAANQYVKPALDASTEVAMPVVFTAIQLNMTQHVRVAEKGCKR